MIKRLLYLLGSFAILSPLALAQTSTWVPDKAHSEVNFSILHMSLAKVRGRFGNIGGSIVLDESDITKSTVHVTIDVTTVDTGVAARDNDLKSAGFFDVSHFPTATFVSTSVAKTGNGLTVNGNLTVHGVTKPVTLDVEGPTGPINGMDRKPHCAFEATTTIKRTDFGIAPKYPATIVGDDVALTIDLDVAKK
ncbi:MAG TPA: YceI family protein [Acidobacteriaceae bacterium]|jgi:polyisoprenoid-binding protein YceI|nr:YceI family protein [Acidobacteriaceae bacterium]